MEKGLRDAHAGMPPAGAASGWCWRRPPPGAELAKRWLEQPVGHLRDVRTELLLKLALRERAGLDNGRFLAAQQAQLAPTIDALDQRRRPRATSSTCGGGRAPGPFAASSSRRSTRSTPSAARPELRLSARNQLHGVVVRPSTGATSCRPSRSCSATVSA